MIPKPALEMARLPPYACGMKENAKKLEFNLSRFRVAVVAAEATNVRIAHALGIETSTLSDRVRGRRRWQPGELEHLEQLLGVSAVWLSEEETP